MPLPNDLIEWYDDCPLTAERIAELRYMLARCRGILMGFSLEPDPAYHPTMDEIKAVIEETNGM